MAWSVTKWRSMPLAITLRKTSYQHLLRLKLLIHFKHLLNFLFDCLDQQGLGKFMGSETKGRAISNPRVHDGIGDKDDFKDPVWSVFPKGREHQKAVQPIRGRKCDFRILSFYSESLIVSVDGKNGQSFDWEVFRKGHCRMEFISKDDERLQKWNQDPYCCATKGSVSIWTFAIYIYK